MKVQIPTSLRAGKSFFSDVCVILLGAMLLWTGLVKFFNFFVSISCILGNFWMAFFWLNFRYTTAIGWGAGLFYIITGLLCIASGVVPFNPIQLGFFFQVKFKF
jgi:hypothetical protein